MSDLAVHYQPIIALDTTTIAGCEALLRVDGDSPVKYLRTLQPELMPALTDWILRQAADRLAYWHQINPYLWVSVNLSTADLIDPNLPHRLYTVCQESAIPIRLLHLEINEGTPIGKPQRDTLHQLRAMGFRLILDDFGAALAGIDRLAAFEWDATKIDRELLPRSDRDWRYCAAINALGALCRELGGRLCCEGIESLWQAEQALAAGCEFGQGWLWYPALPDTDLDRLIK